MKTIEKVGDIAAIGRFAFSGLTVAMEEHIFLLGGLGWLSAILWPLPILYPLYK
jgi:hypothetical protein